MSTPSVHVLIAEDEALIAGLIEVTLDDEGWGTTVVHSGEGALKALRGSAFDILITDIRMGVPPDGWAVAHAARASHPGIGVIYITGDSMDAWRANGVPGSVVLTKPFEPAQVVAAVVAHLNRPGSQSGILSD